MRAVNLNNLQNTRTSPNKTICMRTLNNSRAKKRLNYRVQNRFISTKSTLTMKQINQKASTIYLRTNLRDNNKAWSIKINPIILSKQSSSLQLSKNSLNWLLIRWQTTKDINFFVKIQLNSLQKLKLYPNNSRISQ